MKNKSDEPLHMIDPRSVKQSPDGETLWFSNEHEELYLIHDGHRILYFEIHHDNQAIVGRHDKNILIGDIGESKIGDHYFDGSRLIHLKVPENKDEILKNCLSVVDRCEKLHKQISLVIHQYLDGKNISLVYKKDIKLLGLARKLRFTIGNLNPLKRREEKKKMGDLFGFLFSLFVVTVGIYALAPKEYFLCQFGNGNVCYEQAEKKILRGGFSNEKKRASLLSQKACDLGSIKGCLLRGNIHLANKNLDEVRKYYAPLCDKKIKAACNWLFRDAQKRNLPLLLQQELAFKSCQSYAINVPGNPWYDPVMANCITAGEYYWKKKEYGFAKKLLSFQCQNRKRSSDDSQYYEGCYKLNLLFLDMADEAKGRGDDKQVGKLVEESCQLSGWCYQHAVNLFQKEARSLAISILEEKCRELPETCLNYLCFNQKYTRLKFKKEQIVELLNRNSLNYALKADRFNNTALYARFAQMDLDSLEARDNDILKRFFEVNCKKNNSVDCLKLVLLNSRYENSYDRGTLMKGCQHKAYN